MVVMVSFIFLSIFILFHKKRKHCINNPWNFQQLFYFSVCTMAEPTITVNLNEGLFIHIRDVSVPCYSIRDLFREISILLVMNYIIFPNSIGLSTRQTQLHHFDPLHVVLLNSFILFLSIVSCTWFRNHFVLFCFLISAL